MQFYTAYLLNKLKLNNSNLSMQMRLINQRPLSEFHGTAIKNFLFFRKSTPFYNKQCGY